MNFQQVNDDIISSLNEISDKHQLTDEELIKSVTAITISLMHVTGVELVAVDDYVLKLTQEG